LKDGTAKFTERFNMNVKVSVCIPVYGVEKYIERCARSLFEQTMRNGVEFVFVNDCTPDKSIEILEHVLAKYPHRKEQTKIINLPENGGVGRARRIAIENCTGEYIIHCDPDDWIEPDMYEKMYCAAMKTGADVS
jgi:glycosyltransferase involved in cell wall biosynthesis